MLDFMTAEEVCQKYNISNNTLTKHFARTVEQIEKKYGLKLIKVGRGAKAQYYEEMIEDRRALTIFEETKDLILIDQETLSLANIEFSSFLIIIMTPMMVFRGSYEDFLRYGDITPTAARVSALKVALQNLANKGYIHYAIDKTNPNFFFAGLYRAVEEEFEVGISKVKQCRYLAGKYNMKDWVPLLKTWLAISFLHESEPYTREDIKALTGLTDTMIRKCENILETHNILFETRVYNGLYCCKGSAVDLTHEAFYSIE